MEVFMDKVNEVSSSYMAMIGLCRTKNNHTSQDKESFRLHSKRLREWRQPGAEQERLEAEMVSTLKALRFPRGSRPSNTAQEQAVAAIHAILEQAQAIGRKHATDEEERAVAWGGAFRDLLQSAKDIVSTFIDRIVSWWQGQDEDVSTDDLEAEVESLAETVAGYEVHAAIEEEIWQTLYFAGVSEVRSIAQPGACQACQEKADAGATPIDEFEPPPYHGRCRCSTSPA
jgi:hypothetical protein